MSENWVGYAVSLDCGDTLGSYQGHISAVDTKEQTITLTKVFQNGIPHSSPSVTLSARDIKDLKIIDTSPDAATNSVSIAKPSVKRTGRSVSESLTTTKNSSPMVDVVRKQVTEEMASRNHSVSEGNRTPSKKDRFRNRWTDRNEACFGNHIDNTMDQDFDFEKNLALFNKQAVFDEINASQKPDILRQADSNRQYRHDENIIGSTPIIYKQLIVPSPDLKEYVTDTGLVVPSVTPELRHQLFAAAERLGLSVERQTELFGRAATEIALQLLGGSHRLNPHNAHQWPTVVALCGPHRQGAAGINCARQLASHGIRTLVYVADPQRLPSQISAELALYRVTGNGVVSNVKDLPSVAVDLIILALEGHSPSFSSAPSNGGPSVASHKTFPSSWKQSSSSPALSSLSSSTGIAPVAGWAHENRATVLALDPPATGTGVGTKVTLAPVLPLSHSSDNGKIYLCNLGYPLGAFQDVGIKYRSPFGPKFVIPLYLNDI
ncbi:enhancer of mRNA-decapping protein 3 [Ischnura elegans]|uniref:enhancer of mRNA-decapping protein 3 n=1 Tax=Ischnura elegans TaxID=197161 RepID=UPI001ED885EB|nr:enhancer of mRNA-decapping protein 3 [Ischnura elegans]